MLVGSALGDALGLPVETLTPEQISARYGRITGFESPKDNPFTNGLLTEPGSTSDDFHLTCAIAEAVTKALVQRGAAVSAEDFLELLGQCHLAEYRRSSVGWGGSTIAGVKELEAAGSMRELLSQQRHRPKAEGNGVAMKIAPLALLELSGVLSPADMERVVYGAGEFTHPSAMGVASGFAQVAATKYCLEQSVDTFVPDDFIRVVVSAAKKGEGYFPPADVRLSDGLGELSTLMHASPAEIVQRCGGGSAYVYHSLPFSYAFFLRNFRSSESLFDAVNAGGDADSNGSIVGTLLGSLNGEGVFPAQLTRAMPSIERVVRHAQQLAEQLASMISGSIRQTTLAMGPTQSDQ